jgi:hypothetical protein
MYPKSSNLFQLVAAGLLAFLYLGSVWAQSELKPEVLQTQKTVELIYQSSFQNYQRYSASDIQAWKQANDAVKDIGGWKAYAKEITQEQNTKPPTTTSSHGAHK